MRLRNTPFPSLMPYTKNPGYKKTKLKLMVTHNNKTPIRGDVSKTNQYLDKLTHDVTVILNFTLIIESSTI